MLRNQPVEMNPDRALTLEMRRVYRRLDSLPAPVVGGGR